jgi:hypothetical protein
MPRQSPIGFHKGLSEIALFGSIAMEAGEELDVIRDIKLLKLMFHRMLLRIINGADNYHDCATPGFPIRQLADPVPPAQGK